MPVVRLQSASLESEPESSESSGSFSDSSFNLLQAIKRSSSHLSSEIQRRAPIDPKFYDSTLQGGRLTFSTVTESLSQSSEELTEAFSKQFSLFKTSSNPSEQRAAVEEVQEARHDNETAAFHRMLQSESESTEGYDTTSAWTEQGEQGIFMGPSHRTHQLLDTIGSDAESESQSPLNSMASNSTEESWTGDETAATGSRDFSLLDTLESQDEASVSVGEAEGFTTDGDTYYEEGDSPRSMGSEFEEYADEDGLAELGGILYQIGSCNAKPSFSFDDDYTVTSEIFPPREDSAQDRAQRWIDKSGSYLGYQPEREIRRMKGGPTEATNMAGTPTNKDKGVLASLFSCQG